MRAANDDRQVLMATVRDTPDGPVAGFGPVRIGEGGRAEVEIVFDRPMSVPLSALVADPAVLATIEADLTAICACESDRFDDIMAAGHLDPSRDLVGMDLRGLSLMGTPDRPIDLRGWNLSRCDLTGVRVSHVVADETTLLEDAILDGLHGDAGAEMLQALAAEPSPGMAM